MSAEKAPVEPLTVLPQACNTCPYRKDTPPGIWDTSEYLKLPAYDDRNRMDLGVFHCHNQAQGEVGTVCRGWLSVHGDGLVVRLAVITGLIRPGDVPYDVEPGLYPSGAAACRAGLAGVPRPSKAARKEINKLVIRDRKRAGGKQ